VVASSDLGVIYLHMDAYTRTLVGLAIVFVGAALVGRLFVRLRQPAVIGEVLIGFLLGPSLLGRTLAIIFPVGDRPLLQILADLAVVIFVFLIGLELGSWRGARVDSPSSSC
jgi:Kef-type K+ transport system membrane component KefB